MWPTHLDIWETERDTLQRTRSLSLTLARTGSQWHSLELSRTLSNSLTLAHTSSHSLELALSRSLSHTRSNSLTLSTTRSHSLAISRTLYNSLVFSRTRSHSLALAKTRSKFLVLSRTRTHSLELARALSPASFKNIAAKAFSFHSLLSYDSLTKFSWSVVLWSQAWRLPLEPQHFLKLWSDCHHSLFCSSFVTWSWVTKTTRAILAVASSCWRCEVVNCPFSGVLSNRYCRISVLAGSNFRLLVDGDIRFKAALNADVQNAAYCNRLSRSVDAWSVCSSRSCAEQQRLNGSRTCLGFRILGTQGTSW